MEDNTEIVASVDVDDSNSFVESELEALQSIYINELEIKHGDKKSTCVLIDLHPATADKQEEQYVKMTLKFTLNEDYPHAIPQISIHNPRGLSEEKINGTYQDLLSIAENKIGSSMLFEIIEAAKEHLTAENRPCGECAICLYGFSESDVFTKTDCYHYFHSHCLARYAKDTVELEMDDTKEDEAKKLLCPMCRVPIQFSGTDTSYPPPTATEEDVVIGDEILEIQKKMADLYQKQLEKGGIIDVEAEKNKFLLEISNVPTVSNAPEKSEAVDETAASEIAEETAGVSQLNDKSQNIRDAKEPKNAHVKSDDKPRSKNRGRQGNQNYQNNYPRNNRRYRTHEDRYDDYGDGDYAPDDFEVDARPKYSNSREASYRRDGPRMRRGNRDGFNRGNFRYPRKNSGPYSSNQRQRTFRDNREFDDNQDESPLSDSSPIKEIPATDEEETKETHPTERSSDSYKSRGNYERRGKNQGRFPRGGHRGRGGNPARNDSYGGNRSYRDPRDRNYNSRYREDSRRDSDREGSLLHDLGGKDADSLTNKDTVEPNEGGDIAANTVANQGQSSENQTSPRLEGDEHLTREDSDVPNKRRYDGHRPHNEEKRYQGCRNTNYDDRRYQKYEDNLPNVRRSTRDGYDGNQDRRGYQHNYSDRRGGRGGRGNGGFHRGRGQRWNQDGYSHQGERNSYRSGKFEERQSRESSQNVSEKALTAVTSPNSDAMNGSKSSENSAVPFDPSQKALRPPPGFHNPNKKVVYGQESFNAPPGFPRR